MFLHTLHIDLSGFGCYPHTRYTQICKEFGATLIHATHIYVKNSVATLTQATRRSDRIRLLLIQTQAHWGRLRHVFPEMADLGDELARVAATPILSFLGILGILHSHVFWGLSGANDAKKPNVLTCF